MTDNPVRQPRRFVVRSWWECRTAEHVQYLGAAVSQASSKRRKPRGPGRTVGGDGGLPTVSVLMCREHLTGFSPHPTRYGEAADSKADKARQLRPPSMSEVKVEDISFAASR